MPHGEYCLTVVFFLYPLYELRRSLQEIVKRLDIVRPHLMFQVGNIPSGKPSPIALSQHCCRLDVEAMPDCYHLSRINSTRKVTCNNGIQMYSGKFNSQHFSLFDAVCREFALCLSLDYTVHIVNGFSVSYQI